MRFRFIGQYTNGHTTINANGVDFVGHEPAEVTDKAAIASLKRHPEFEELPEEPEAAEDVPAEGIDDAMREIQAIAAAATKKPRRKRAG